MLADHSFQTELFLIFMGIIAQEYLYTGTAPDAFGFRAFQSAQREAAGSVGSPDMGSTVTRGGHGRDFHLLRHHEHGIEADAEAADDLGGVVGPGIIVFDDGFLAVGGSLFLLFLILGGRGGLFRLSGTQELFGTGMGDGAEVLHHFLFRHAYAGIGNGENMVVLVHGDADFQRQVRIAHFAARGLEETHLLQRIGRVGKKLTKKDFVVGVQRVGENVEQFARFRAKLMRGFRHVWPPDMFPCRSRPGDH